MGGSDREAGEEEGRRGGVVLRWASESMTGFFVMRMSEWSERRLALDIGTSICVHYTSLTCQISHIHQPINHILQPIGYIHQPIIFSHRPINAVRSDNGPSLRNEVSGNDEGLGLHTPLIG